MGLAEGLQIGFGIANARAQLEEQRRRHDQLLVQEEMRRALDEKKLAQEEQAFKANQASTAFEEWRANVANGMPADKAGSILTAKRNAYGIPGKVKILPRDPNVGGGYEVHGALPGQEEPIVTDPREERRRDVLARNAALAAQIGVPAYRQTPAPMPLAVGRGSMLGGAGVTAPALAAAEAGLATGMEAGGPGYLPHETGPLDPELRAHYDMLMRGLPEPPIALNDRLRDFKQIDADTKVSVANSRKRGGRGGGAKDDLFKFQQAIAGMDQRDIAMLKENNVPDNMIETSTGEDSHGKFTRKTVKSGHPQSAALNAMLARTALERRGFEIGRDMALAKRGIAADAGPRQVAGNPKGEATWFRGADGGPARTAGGPAANKAVEKAAAAFRAAKGRRGSPGGEDAYDAAQVALIAAMEKAASAGEDYSAELQAVKAARESRLRNKTK